MMLRAIVAACLLVTPAWAEVNIQEVTSPGGIKAWLVEEPSIPFMALEIRFRGGASLEDADKRGATNLMMALLEEGAGDLDARAFAEERESLAARYSFDAFTDSVSVSAEFLTENRDEAVELLRKAINEPRFDAAAIARVQGQVVSSIQSDLKDPDDISTRTFYLNAFDNHPYGSSSDGTVATVTGLTAEDLEAARLAAMVKDRVFIGAVGDITATELGPLLDTLLGDLPQSGPDLPARIDYEKPGGVTVVNFEGPQSTTLFGHVGIERDDPRYFAAYILMEIMGGGLESRLSSEVRENRGLTYSIGSFLVPRDLSELILGRVRSSNDTIAEAIDVIRAEWAKMAEGGVTEEELARMQTYLTGAYPLRFDGNANIANILAGMQQAELGVEYIETRNANIEAVTLAEINQVAADILRPDELHFVVVGEPVGLASTN